MLWILSETIWYNPQDSEEKLPEYQRHFSCQGAIPSEITDEFKNQTGQDWIQEYKKYQTCYSGSDRHEVAGGAGEAPTGQPR